MRSTIDCDHKRWDKIASKNKSAIVDGTCTKCQRTKAPSDYSKRLFWLIVGLLVTASIVVPTVLVIKARAEEQKKQDDRVNELTDFYIQRGYSHDYSYRP
jgi:hypothetical protein